MATKQRQRFFYRREAARLANVSEETLHNYERRGLVSPARMSRGVVYQHSDIERVKRVFEAKKQTAKKKR